MLKQGTLFLGYKNDVLSEVLHWFMVLSEYYEEN